MFENNFIFQTKYEWQSYFVYIQGVSEKNDVTPNSNNSTYSHLKDLKFCKHVEKQLT